MVGLAEALSYEVEDAGVHVLTVCPGTIRTEFFDEEALRACRRCRGAMMVDAGPMVEAIIDALAAGKHEMTFPRKIAAGYIVRALAPGFMRRNVRRTTIGTAATAPLRASVSASRPRSWRLKLGRSRAQHAAPLLLHGHGARGAVEHRHAAEAITHAVVVQEVDVHPRVTAAGLHVAVVVVAPELVDGDHSFANVRRGHGLDIERIRRTS